MSGFPVREAHLGAPIDDDKANQVEFLSGFMREEAGANAAEYALVLLVITVFIVTALSSIANGISNTVNAARVGIAS